MKTNLFEQTNRSLKQKQKISRQSDFFVTKSWVIVIMVILFSLNYKTSQAANISSTGTGGNWNLTTTWVGGIVPGSADNVTIVAGATVTLVADYTTSGSLTINGNGILALNGFNFTSGAVTTSAASQIGNTGVLKNFSLGSLNNASTLAGVVSGNISLVKTGTGALTISGNNTYSGFTTLSAGTLNINSATALGTGTFVIGAGTIIDNSTGSAITLSNNNPQSWNGNFSFTGTKNLNLGTGAVTLYGPVQLTVSNGTLTAGGAISGATYNLTKAGTGTFSLGSNAGSINDLSVNAGTFISTSGTLNIAGDFSSTGTFNASTGTVNFNGGVQNIGAATFNNLTISNGGQKSLTGAVRVNGILNLNSGILLPGSFNLTMAGTVGAGSIMAGAAFGSTNMIETDGTGLLVFSNASIANTTLNGTYPLGNNGTYNPLIISGLTGAAANRTLNLRVVTSQLFFNGINRHWEISHTNVTGTATLSFRYNNTETSGDVSKFQLYTNYSGAWTLAPSASAAGVNPMTSTTTVVLPATSQWTAASPAEFYSYQSGDWNNPATWTNDPSGTTLINPVNAVPGYLDVVTILTGRTVDLSSNIAVTGLDLTINDGGFLNLLGYQFTNGLKALKGQGTLKISPSNAATGYFPATVTNTLINAGGGTVEYNVTTNLPTSITNYNNLTINTSGTVSLISNLSLFGNLLVKAGSFQINDGTATRRQLTVTGDVMVNNGGAITVSNANTTSITDPTGITTTVAGPFINYYDAQSHRFVVKGDFINNGSVKLTNLTGPLYNAFPTNGFATLYFQGSANNVFTCNGPTDLYNLVIDKGTDQTFALTLYSSAFTNFRLFGANTAAYDILMGATMSNPNVKKALWVRNGTLNITGLTVIPSLSEGTVAAAPSSDFVLPANGALILDGAFVTVLGTSDDYSEINAAYGLSGVNNAAFGINTSGAGSGFSVLGKLQLNNGYLSTRESSGMLYWSYASGQINVNGGKLDTKQIHNPEGGSTGLVSFAQTGGTILLRGRFPNTINYTTVGSLSNPTINTVRNANGTDGTAGIGTFNINSNAANGFVMSGGNITIYDVCGTTATSYAVDINCPTSNINVTGGTFQILPTTGTNLADANYLINSNAPFGNILINRVSGTSSVKLITNPMNILQDLTLQSGVFDANALNVSVGGNFSIASGTTYTCTGASANRTIFNGINDQTFTVNLASPLALNRFIINKSASKTLAFAGSQTVINVADSLMIKGGQLNDNGNTINASGGVYNTGIAYGTGKIALTGTNTQTIDGNGSGVFTNLDLNNTNAASAPVSLTSGIIVNGALRLVSNKIFNIGTYNLKIGASGSIISVPGYGTSCFIQNSGNSGDAGLTKVYSSNTAFLFPIGATSVSHTTTAKYTPATIGFTSSPTTYGSITVIPVGYEHPSTTANNQSLSYFWRVKSSGFTGIPANSVSHNFVYDQTDVIGTEANYIPSLYNTSNYSWNNGTTANPPINVSTNTITDWSTPSNSKAFLDADYTAGDNTTSGGAFGASVKFYSVAGTAGSPAAWNSSSTWSHTSGGTAIGGASTVGVSYPGPNSIVVIENNHYILLSATANCASLQIQSGSTLDIYTYTSSVFSMVQNYPSGNNGLFRLTTSVTGSNVPKVFSFPANSDFTDFNNNHGTTEFYDIDGATGQLYILPANVTTYGNLMVTAKGGDNLVLPNNSLTTILGDLTCGGDNPNAWIAVSWNTNVAPYNSGIYNPTIEKTIHITGNLNVNTGTLIFMPENVPQHFIVDGNLTVGANGYIDVQPVVYSVPTGAPVANTISIGGNFINNSTGTPYVRLLNSGYYCNLTFQGAGNTIFSGTSTNTTVNNITVNKGNSQSSTLTVNIGGTLSTPTDNWLTMVNGTLIYNRTGNFNISTSTPFIIPSTAGLTINTPSNVLIANASSNNNDLFLNGKLTLASGNTGTVYVGPSSSPTNNNDIEYSSGGASTIQVDGGSLIVNGAIRRNPSNPAGILNYSQSGSSSVTINGNNALTSNAKLEVLNNGSQFNMSGSSTLNIVRGGGVNFGDLYLRPQTSSVTGTSTIVFSQGSLAAQNYQLNSNAALNNLTITGASGKVAKVTLMVDPLTVNGNLTINANSILDANVTNNIPVTINGNFINSGSYLTQKNRTTFGGNVQTITGSTTPNTFYDLVVRPMTSLTLNPTSGNISVSDSLTIGSGTLVCGTNKVTLLGNLTNNGNFTDNNTFGTGISLSGTTAQHVGGTGSFGWLELNNTAGAILDNSITLNEHLTLSQGIFNIKQNVLTLQQNSTIDANPVSTFSATKMVSTDGVLGDIGIKKFFTTAAQTFTYPIGTTGKYTPALLSITSSDYVGSIRVNNVNASQPTILDPANALEYYWDVESSGISGFQGNMKFTYLAGDVAGGPESSYQSAWLIVPGSSWSINGGTVTPASKTIQFNYPAGTENISGEYTAGIGSAFPANVPTYTSNGNGNWNNPAIWTQTSGVAHTLTTGPNGFIVIIRNGDVVTTSTNYCSAYQTTINGKLVVQSGTYGHNFGNVTGNGTLSLQSGTFPAGVYTAFLDCLNNGTIEYGGSGSYLITADLYDHVANLLFTGTGTRILPNKDLTICNSFKIDGPTVDNSTYNRQLTILGTMERYNSGIFKSGTGASATVTFAGTSTQTLGGSSLTGDFTGTSAFNNLEIDNSAGLTINTNGSIEVSGNLLLTNGLINTSTANNSRLSITNTAINCVFPAGGSTTSFVNGPLSKMINQGDQFLFPIGKGTLPGNRITISSTQTGPILWTSGYNGPNSTFNSYAAPLSAVSWNEYWSVVPASASQAIINLGYYSTSDITPLVTVNGITDMRVAKYNGSQWNAITSTGSGTNYTGTISTSAVVSNIAGENTYTLAAVTSIVPKAKFAPTGPICGNTGVTGIPVTFSAPVAIPTNYTLNYTLNGVSQTPVTVTPAMLPYTLPTTFAGTSAVYVLTGFTYNNGAGTGVVDATPVTAYANPTVANAGAAQSVCGITSVTLAGNNPAPYTGTWSVVNGAGGTILSPNSATSQFNGILPNNYTLNWTINNGACKSVSAVTVAFTTRPNPPVAASTQTLCSGATISNINVTASSGFINWYNSSTYPPVTSALTSGTALTNGATYYANAVSGTCSSASPLTPVTVTLVAQPSSPVLSVKTPNALSVCEGVNVNATITAGSGGVGCSDSYQYRFDGGSWNTYTSGTILSTTGHTSVDIQVQRSGCTANSGCSGTPWTTIASWAINPLPNLVITSPSAVCSPSTVDITAPAVTSGSNLLGGSLSYWNDPGVSSSLVNPSSVSTSGTYYIKTTSLAGCSSVKPVTVLIQSLPSAISGAGSVCVGSSITLSDATAGGTWSSSNTSAATITSGGVVSGITSGSTVISYTLGTGCFVTLPVNVLVVPVTGPAYRKPNL